MCVWVVVVVGGGGGCMTFYDFLFAFPFKKDSILNREDNLLLEV